MTDEPRRTCIECGGELAPIIVMDRDSHAFGNAISGPQGIEYRLPGDSRNFWGQYPTAGRVQALMCGECGRIALYGRPPETPEP